MGPPPFVQTKEGSGRMGNAFRGKCGVGLFALAGLGALASPASAAFITFDPDGAASANAPQTIGGLDWAVGNALGDNFSGSTLAPGGLFQIYYQAALAGVINTQGQTAAPSGLNSDFEITMVMRTREVIDAVHISGGGNNTIIHHLVPAQTGSFVEIWYDTSPDANNLAGTG